MLLHHAPRRSKKIAGSCPWGFAWGQQCDFFVQRSCDNRIAPADRRDKIALAGRAGEMRGGGEAKKSPRAADVFPHGLGAEQKNRFGQPGRKNIGSEEQKNRFEGFASEISNSSLYSGKAEE